MPEFLRPARRIGNRRDSVRSHSCHVGLRRIPTGVLPKFPMPPFGCAMRNAARLKRGWSANGRLRSTVYPLKIGSPVSSHRDVAALVKKPSVNDGFVFAMPLLLDVQLGVTAWPLCSRVTPEICQSLRTCLSTGAC